MDEKFIYIPNDNNHKSLTTFYIKLLVEKFGLNSLEPINQNIDKYEFVVIKL